MGTEQGLMLHLWAVLVENQPPKQIPPTPDQLNATFTPNQKLLQAACAYVDAFILKAPGTDPAKARALANTAFTAQLQSGHNVIPQHETDEVMTSSHAQLWHAGAGALLYASLQAGDTATAQLAQGWWRGEAALNHLTGWATSWKLGSYKVIAPGARGGARNPSDDAGVADNAARDLDYELLLTGKLGKTTAAALQAQGKYYLGTILLLRLSPAQLDPIRKAGTGKPLVGPNGQAGPWTVNDVPLLPATLSVLRNGNQHSAWFAELHAYMPQLQAGVNASGPWYKFFDDANPPLEHGGPSPFPAPTQPAGTVQRYGKG